MNETANTPGLVTVQLTKTQIELITGSMETLRTLSSTMGWNLNLEANEPIIELLKKASQNV